MTPDERAQLTELADQRRADVESEYGQFVAARDIYVGSALAYREGSAVPVSNVKQHGYLQNGLVVTAEQAAADAAAREAEAAKARAEDDAARDAAFQEALEQAKLAPGLATAAADAAAGNAALQDATGAVTDTVTALPGDDPDAPSE